MEKGSPTRTHVWNSPSFSEASQAEILKSNIVPRTILERIESEREGERETGRERVDWIAEIIFLCSATYTRGYAHRRNLLLGIDSRLPLLVAQFFVSRCFFFIPGMWAKWVASSLLCYLEVYNGNKIKFSSINMGDIEKPIINDFWLFFKY